MLLLALPITFGAEAVEGTHSDMKFLRSVETTMVAG